PPFHEVAVRTMLAWHADATGSALAARLLAEWATTREHIAVGTPLALMHYQDADHIWAAHGRKELLDELAGSVAADRLREFKRS
ncbi:hypothetical protein PJN25_29790, partial [Mycobacterium kansasii]